MGLCPQDPADGRENEAGRVPSPESPAVCSWTVCRSPKGMRTSLELAFCSVNADPQAPRGQMVTGPENRSSSLGEPRGSQTLTQNLSHESEERLRGGGWSAGGGGLGSLSSSLDLSRDRTLFIAPQDKVERRSAEARFDLRSS